MSVTTPMPGVSRHPNGGWRVRISPFPARAGFHTVDEANEYAVELRRLKRQGILVAPTPLATMKYKTLRDYAELRLKRLATVGGRKGKYSIEGLAKARGDARPWLGEPIPPRKRKGVIIEVSPAIDPGNGLLFADMPVRALTLPPIDQWLQERAAKAQRAAVGERQFLLSTLRLAAQHGEIVSPALRELDPIRRTRTRRTGLSLAELRFLAAHAQESQQRVLLLGGTLGGRIMELLQSEDDWYDLEARTVTIPGWATKQRRGDLVIDLLDEEVALVREQKLVRSPTTQRGASGTRLLFPRVGGTPWNKHSGFWNNVIVPTRRKAAKAWREKHDLALGAPTPFEWPVIDAHGEPVIDVDGKPKIGGFAPHDLRRGAATLLRDLGIEPELAAARLGHKDGGHLLLTVYADTAKRTHLRRELDAIAADGGIDGRLAKLAEVGS